MIKDMGFLLKFLSPRILTKAITLIDKSTAVVVGGCWVAALIMLIIASFSVHSAVSAKKAAADAVASEPVLPQSTSTPINAVEGQGLVERMQRQFPDLKIDIDGSQAIIIRAQDGPHFHEWINALGYVDTMAPQYRWTMREFCVGHCGQDLMRAVVTGQKIVFSMPQV